LSARLFQQTFLTVVLSAAQSVLVSFACALSLAAQSPLPDFPTPVSSTQISGKISARNIGDPRTTDHYWVFEADAGDIFINVVAENLTGDVDVFMAGTLKPLTKLKIYADSTAFESGRVIYVRKRERLILRVTGRSPNDDPATYQIKFAGSFQALARDENAPVLPTVAERAPNNNDEPLVVAKDSNKKKKKSVDSVAAPSVDEGTVINSEATEAAVNSVKSDANPTVASTRSEKAPEEPPRKLEDTIGKPAKRSVRISQSSEEVPVLLRRKKRVNVASNKTTESTTTDETARPTSTNEAEKSTDAKSGKEISPAANTAPVDPMANVKLSVVLKDGKEMSFVMSNVLRFGVEKGTLTIVTKDGTTTKHLISNVQRVTIE